MKITIEIRGSEGETEYVTIDVKKDEDKWVNSDDYGLYSVRVASVEEG